MWRQFRRFEHFFHLFVADCEKVVFIYHKIRVLASTKQGGYASLHNPLLFYGRSDWI